MKIRMRHTILLLTAVLAVLLLPGCAMEAREEHTAVEPGYPAPVSPDNRAEENAENSTGDHTEISSEEASAAPALTEGTVAEGVSVLRVPLGGLSEAEALRVIDEQFERLLSRSYVLNSGGESLMLTAAELSIGSNREKAYGEMREALLTGTEAERLATAQRYLEKPKDIAPELWYDRGQIENAFRKAVREHWEVPVRNAEYEFSPHGELHVTADAAAGVSYDFSEGLDHFIAEIADIYSGKNMLVLNAVRKEREAGLTRQQLEGFTVIGSYMTYYNELTEEDALTRTRNLIASSSHMNGSCFSPGEEISALAMYGEVTEENGYSAAGTFQDGGLHEAEMGGGICQTTTTLYNAALLAELEIVYRSNHSMFVNYAPASQDAMVYPQNGSDFKMRNNTSDWIVIESWVEREDMSIHVNIWGHEDHAEDHLVRYEPEILEYTLPTVTFVDSDEAGIGWVNVSKKIRQLGTIGPVCGMRSRLWKVTTDGGKETRTLVNELDEYRPDNGAVYAVSPDAFLGLHVKENSPESCYIGFDQLFADRKTPLNADPARMTPEERIAFNREMSAILREKGLEWPYSGDAYR